MKFTSFTISNNLLNHTANVNNRATFRATRRLMNVTQTSARATCAVVQQFLLFLVTTLKVSFSKLFYILLLLVKAITSVREELHRFFVLITSRN